jgi:hypothetical protein
VIKGLSSGLKNNKGNLPKKEYTLSEDDLLRMMSGYISSKRGIGVAPKFWFDRGDYILTLEVEENK